MLLNIITTARAWAAGAVWLLLVAGQSAASDSVLPAQADTTQTFTDSGGKFLDDQNRHVAAVVLQDESGRFLTNATAVAIHPQVLLTAAHVAPSFAVSTYLAGHDVGNASISFGSNFREDGRRIEIRPDQWISYPGFGELGEAGRRALDVAVIILDETVSAPASIRLIESSAMNTVTPTTPLMVSGYGLHLPADQSRPFPPLQTDGHRRFYLAQKMSLSDEAWLTISGPAQAGDSGSPVVVTRGDDMQLLGLVSQSAPGDGTLVLRLDNPDVAQWIRSVVRERLKLQL